MFSSRFNKFKIHYENNKIVANSGIEKSGVEKIKVAKSFSIVLGVEKINTYLFTNIEMIIDSLSQFK